MRKICTGCGECAAACSDKENPSEFNMGLGQRSAIYVPFPQAVPNKPVIDRLRCSYFKTGKCKFCVTKCPAQAIRLDQQMKL